MMGDNCRRVIMVTGGNEGIGWETVKKFHESGDDVVAVVDKHIDDHLRSLDRVGIAWNCDVSDRQCIRKFIEHVIQLYGRIDVLVSNAGILRSGPSIDFSWDLWNEIINVNLSGAWNVIQSVLPAMCGQGRGRIIIVSSELGLIGYPEYAAYCASKGALISLTKAIAKEFAPQGVLINSIAPGPIATNLLKTYSSEFNDQTRELIPVNRFGTPNEIADVIYFLASESASYFVGQVISPNGGTAI